MAWATYYDDDLDGDGVGNMADNCPSSRIPDSWIRMVTAWEMPATTTWTGMELQIRRTTASVANADQVDTDGDGLGDATRTMMATATRM